MGIAESKSHHRHRGNKHRRCKGEGPAIHRYPNQSRPLETFTIGNRNLPHERHGTIEPLITSSPMNPAIQGSLLHHSFPMQRSHSEIHIAPYDSPHNEITGSANQLRGVYDYRKHMQRVDEENRPILEGLCPEKMYVSTNDLRICDTQRLPPPLRCRMTQGFFRSIPESEFHRKKTTTKNASFL